MNVTFALFQETEPDGEEVVKVSTEFLTQVRIGVANALFPSEINGEQVPEKDFEPNKARRRAFISDHDVLAHSDILAALSFVMIFREYGATVITQDHNDLLADVVAVITALYELHGK